MYRIRSHGRALAAALLLVLVTVPLVRPGVAEAHERRDVGGYGFVVGWLVEPSYEGQKNGIDLRITGKDGKPFVGAEKTLKLEVTHVDSNTTKPFTIRAVFNSPGAYTADIVPTVSGVYKFHFTGNLEGNNVDQTFTSGPNTFGNIEPLTGVEFPQAVASDREIQAAAKGAADASSAASAAARSASDAVSTTRLLAIAGLAFGVVGTAFGVMSLRRR